MCKCDFNVKCVHPSSVHTLFPTLCGHLHMSPFSADGVSQLEGIDYNHMRKVEMRECFNLSRSLLATICCNSSLEELIVTSGVSDLSVCLTMPCIY